MQKRNNSDFLTERQKEEIENLAEYIADYYSPRGSIDLELIAEKKGITFSYGNYDDAFDGMLDYYEGDFHIYINIDRLGHAYTERARFTFAHELGHYFIDNHRNALRKGLTPSHPSYTGFVSHNIVEKQADYFASCLLLPQKRLKADCYRRKFSFSIIQELAKKYQTSLTATSLRFASLGNHPIMVVCSMKNSIKWYWYSNDFRFWSLKYGKTRVPEDTAAGEYFSKGIKYTNSEIVFADDWFNIRFDNDRERKFYEHNIYGNDNVISVIWED